MRLRLRSVSYQFGGASQSLEQHYRALRDELLRQGQHYGLLQRASQWRPPVDIHETPQAILVKIELAGMREDDIEIGVYPNALVVAGRRDDDSDHDETVCYHEAQVRYGPFRAEILLPVPVQQDAVEATYNNGFLRLRLPKTVASEPRPVRREMTGESPTRERSGGNMYVAPADDPQRHGVTVSQRKAGGVDVAPTRREV